MPMPTRCSAITTATRKLLADRMGNYLYTNTEWFFQDDWKVKSNLSFSYGIRFYDDPAQYEAGHQLSSFSPSAWNPATAPVLIRPAVVNGANVGINPLNGTTYAYGLVGDFVPGRRQSGGRRTHRRDERLASVTLQPRADCRRSAGGIRLGSFSRRQELRPRRRRNLF